MRKKHAIMWLVGIVVLGGGILPGLNSAAAAAVGTDDAVLWPPDGHVFTNQWYDIWEIEVDLSQAGDTDPDHRWEVSLRDDAGTWRLLETIWGTGKTSIPGPRVGPGEYAVRVDPLWLDDTHTVVHAVTVTYDPEVYVGSTIDFRDSFFHGQVKVLAHLEFPPVPRDGDVVRWIVYRRDDGCGYQGVPLCPEVVSGTIVPAGGLQWVDLPISDLPGGTFEAVVYRVLEPDTDRYNDIFMVLPPPEASDLTAAPRTFYPRVADGFRDHTTLSWRQNLTAATAIRVLRGKTTIRRARLGSLPEGGHTWTWDGRDDSGRLVPPDTYRMRVRVTDGAGNTDAAITKVKVATATVTRRATIERRGTHTSRRTKAGVCGFRAAGEKLTLVCAGGRYARAAYSYRVPRRAFDLEWVVRGRRGCCAPGHVIITGKRTSATRYRAAVKVTDRRSYTVAAADLHYKYKVRR